MSTVKQKAREKEIQVTNFFGFEQMPAFDLVYTGSWAGDPQSEKYHTALQTAASEMTLPYIEGGNVDDIYSITSTKKEYDSLMQRAQKLFNE